ncbi:hypothetical protein PsorP6_017791 [Peronosclerospora sorghi]|uniref:Uncharacterized protein n=1 Tax=Peronosclerospora sorghi TaxID=230839 RepID=A0ACC0WKI4_9STRA|nr:hypothetical protein PsorP6_017791 [Peronosclerospora sorghi]
MDRRSYTEVVQSGSPRAKQEAASAVFPDHPDESPNDIRGIQYGSSVVEGLCIEGTEFRIEDETDLELWGVDLKAEVDSFLALHPVGQAEITPVDPDVNRPTTPEFHDQITYVNPIDFLDFDLHDNYDDSDDYSPSSARGVRSPASSYVPQSNNTHGVAIQSYLRSSSSSARGLQGPQAKVFPANTTYASYANFQPHYSSQATVLYHAPPPQQTYFFTAGSSQYVPPRQFRYEQYEYDPRHQTAPRHQYLSQEYVARLPPPVETPEIQQHLPYPFYYRYPDSYHP